MTEENMALSVNWYAVLLAAVAAWLFGAVYYGLLAKRWVAAQGKTMDAFKAEMAARSVVAQRAPFVLSFVAELVMAGVLSGVMFHIGPFTPRSGLITGALCWLGFVLTTLSVNYGYGGRSPRLTAIDAGHWLGVMLIMGAIIGWMGR
jgi:hypothetical protein